MSPVEERVVAYLRAHPGSAASMVGAHLWPNRTGRISAVQGGGDYAAQMLLGRMRKKGLVRYAHSIGSTRWEAVYLR